MIFPDMDFQAKYHPQGESGFFADGRADRPAPAGTIKRGDELALAAVFSSEYENEAIENPEMYSGKDASDAWLKEFPVTVDRSLIELGQKKYDIYCQVCHGAAGDGKGITANYGIAAAANFHSDLYRQMSHGEIFNTVRMGKNTMKGYGDKLNAEESWAVVAYVRALQQAFYTTEAELTPELKAKLGL
ncbi:MAG: c-type cytochrome [Opitutales bacterium]